MKYRTIEEAKAVQIPNIPLQYIEKYNALAKTIRSGNESGVSKLRKIYGLTDTLTEFVAPYVVCEKGCSHCCRIDVLVTSVEAQYIYKNLGITPISGRHISTGHSESRRPCPFLSADNRCSIYEYRPFACRTYHALDDPAFCADPKAKHAEYSSKSNELLNQLFYMLGFINGNQPIRDIRDFFPSGIKA